MSDQRERIQLNLRLDGQRELYEAIKAAAEKNETSVNQFVINALKAALGWEPAESPAKTLDKHLALVASIEERLATLEERLALVSELDKRLAVVEDMRGKLRKSAA